MGRRAKPDPHAMGSSNDDMLRMFSAGFIVVMSLLLIVPVLRRKSDVFTAWNFFLVGAIIFGGLSGFNATMHEHYLPTYKSADYQKFYVGAVVFYTTIVLTYHFFKFPRRLAGRHLLEWPGLNPAIAPLIVLPLGLLVVFRMAPIGVPGLQEFLVQASLSGPVIGFAVAFVMWYRRPTNVFLAVVVVAAGMLAIFAATSGGSSRRYLIAALAAPVVGLYWVWLRYKSTPIIIGWIASGLACVMPLLLGFTMIRHVIRNNSESSSQQFSLLLQELPNAVKKGGSLEGFMGQDSVEGALLLIHLLNDGSKTLEVEPFYAPYWLVVNPIPRSIWPDKPISLGIRLVKRSGLGSQGMNFNMGINVVSQCYFDGGLWIHVLYAILFGSFLRFFDELLVRQPGNPYIVGALVAMSGQILGWPRGSIELMSLQMLLVCFLTVMVGWVGRAVLGGGLSYPRTDHLVDYPVLRSEKDRQRWLQSITGVMPTFGRVPVPSA